MSDRKEPVGGTVSALTAIEWERTVPAPIKDYTAENEGNPEGYNAYLSRDNFPKPYEVLPQVQADSDVGMELNIRAYEAFSSVLPKSEHASECVLKSPGVPDEWKRLLNIMGVGHNPEGVPPFDNRGYLSLLRAENKDASKLVEVLPPETRRRAQWIVDRFVRGTGTDASIVIKNEVIVGMPDMDKTAVFKRAIADMWLEEYRNIAKLYFANDLDALTSRYGIYFAYIVGRRYQPDKVETVGGRPSGKPRLVRDWTGKWIVASKELPERIRRKKHGGRFLSCRSRKINVSPLRTTFPLRAICRSIKRAVDAAYPETFRQGDATYTQLTLEGANSMALFDVDNHDVNMPFEIMVMFCEAVGKQFGSFFGQLMYDTFRMGQIIKNDYRGGTGVRAEGISSDRRDFIARYVNPSGHPATSLLANLATAIFFYDAGVRSGRLVDTEGGVDDFLRGRAKDRAKIMGDNVMLATKEAGVDLVSIYRSNSIMALLSTTETYGGLVAMQTEAGPIILVPSITSYVNNILVPGRDLRSPQRGFWGPGWRLRQPFYRRAPAYDLAHETMNEVVNAVRGVPMDALALAAERDSAISDLAVTEIDAEYLANPDIVEYKRDYSEVSPELLDMMNVVIPPTEHAGAISWLMEMAPLLDEAQPPSHSSMQLAAQETA